MSTPTETPADSQTTGARTTTGLTALGMGGVPWQELLEKAYSTGTLSVTGELSGGQLLAFNDVSGAQLFILAAPPYAAYAGFDALTDCEAEISMLSDVLALLSVHDDEGNIVCDIAANLAQGPLLVDEPTQLGMVNVSALGVDTHVYSDEKAFSDAGGATTGFVISHGAAVVNAGSGDTEPSAAGDVSLVVTSAEKRTNGLTGEPFWHVNVDAPFPVDLCLPESAADNITQGNIVAGRVLFTASVAADTSAGGCCGGGGGCGCGACGCGGH
ncbi:hypothetical protein [uncultured Corynebacterium sp.]|uniref:hypothetical protein n=1 Tax=uncultured Corynebacterium sp. TaxID=159447 RepID=UPI0025ECB725|nr:hypothetical protein [uncultured Corynebacterium sp.]